MTADDDLRRPRTEAGQGLLETLDPTDGSALAQILAIEEQAALAARSEPRAEGLLWHDDVICLGDDCEVVDRQGNHPTPETDNAATPPAEGLDALKRLRARVLDAPVPVYARASTRRLVGFIDEEIAALASEQLADGTTNTPAIDFDAPNEPSPAEGREALWAMWTSGEKLAYGCGYRDGRNAATAEGLDVDAFLRGVAEGRRLAIAEGLLAIPETRAIIEATAEKMRAALAPEQPE